jgi:hypothetical protein
MDFMPCIALDTSIGIGRKKKKLAMFLGNFYGSNPS